MKIDLGRNIVETARASGVPSFSARNIAGLVSYSVSFLPTDLPVTFTREGLEATFSPVFSVTMYADEEDKNNLAVTLMSLQLSTGSVIDHLTGQQFVSGMKQKFSSKKWARHIPELCPAVTGRSNFIQADGTIESFEACPLDPDFTIAAAEWRTLALKGLTYEWIGDGIICTVDVKATEDSRGVTYRVTVEYKDKIVRARRDAKNLAEKLSDGDRQGWNSTAKHKKNLEIMTDIAKAAELAAVKRGDKIVQRAAN